MAITKLSAATLQARREALDAVLARARGVLHLGAHLGQEADTYAKAGKAVLWVEAQPAIHARLVERLRAFPDQRALCAVLGDEDGRTVRFNVSNNLDGISSSLFAFGSHSEGDQSLWPRLNLHMVDTLELTMMTLDTLLAREGIDPAAHDHWIVDLQGAELLALQGAARSLPSCDSLLVEVSEDAVYDGGVRWPVLRDFLEGQGFRQRWSLERQHDDILFLRA